MMRALSLIRAGITAASINKTAGPQGPDPYWANVVLLAHCDGTEGSTTLLDSKGRHTFTAAGNAQITATNARLGNGCATFDGTGDYFETSQNPEDFRFGTEDFTIELYVRRVAGDGVVLDHFVSNGTGWEIFVTSTGTIQFYVNSSNIFGSNISLGTNTWHHYAVSRNGSTLRIFLNGQLRNSYPTYSINHASVLTKLGVGGQVNSREAQYDWNGQVDEIRITKGVGRYVADFIPPQAPFSDS